VFGGEGAERQANADDDSRQDHADCGLGLRLMVNMTVSSVSLCYVRFIAGLR
jgi:hypothetical protein